MKLFKCILRKPDDMSRNPINPIVHPKESLYYNLMIIVTVILLVPTILLTPLLLLFALMVLFINGILIGHIRGNGVRVSKNQYPQLHTIIQEQCVQLAIKNEPKTYIVESGFLNAFAMRFVGSDYMILYSELAELILDKKTGEDVVRFVIAHELTHIKRKHINKKLWVLPALFVPLLPQAYFRACEYTCDATAAKISPKGAVAGIKMLAIGTELYADMDARDFAGQAERDGGFWTWWAEKLATHPHLSKRLTPELFRASFVSHASGKNGSEAFGHRPESIVDVPVEEEPILRPVAISNAGSTENHEKYLPKGN